VHEHYSKLFPSLKRVWDEFEKEELAEQKDLMKKAKSLWATGSTAAAIDVLNDYSSEKAAEAYNKALEQYDILTASLTPPPPYEPPPASPGGVQPPDAAPPAVSLSAPQSLKASASSYNAANLSWGGADPSAKYEVYRSTRRDSAFAKIGETAGSSWQDRNLKTGTVYYYKVRGYLANGAEKVYSPYSGLASAKAALAAPKLKLKKSGSAYVTASWGKVAGANGYNVYRAAKKNGQYKLCKIVKSAKTLKWTDKKTRKKSTYYYKVKAYRTVDGKKVYSAYSPVKQIRR
jgi:hypothetical protein